MGDRICKWLELQKQASDSIFPVVGDDGVEFPDGVHEDFLQSEGRRWNPIRGDFDTTTFLEHQSGKGCLQSSAVLAGASAGGR